MVLIDTSAWIAFFRNSDPVTCERVRNCLRNENVVIGDLIYCEIVQGIRDENLRLQVTHMLHSLPGHELVGFEIAEKAAENYRYLRTRGITIRKTIDIIVATFCIENACALLHCDRDYAHIASELPLSVYI